MEVMRVKQVQTDPLTQNMLYPCSVTHRDVFPTQELSVGSFPVILPAAIPIILLLLLLQQPFQKRSSAVGKDRAALTCTWVFLTGIRVQAR